MVFEKHLKAVPLKKALKAFEGAYVYCDRWWIVRDDCLLFYRGFSPQCNADKKCAESIRDRLYPNAEVVFLPVVFAQND